MPDAHIGQFFLYDYIGIFSYILVNAIIVL